MHRDIRPENFLLERERDIVYIVGYSVSKIFWDYTKEQHIPFMDNRKLVGELRYASLNAQAGCEQSRRDDLESLGYVLVYLFKGSLPWQNFEEPNKNSREEVIKCKAAMPLEELCEGLPEEFVTYLSYCRSLPFEEKPDYEYLKKLFSDYFHEKNMNQNFKYDWKIKGIKVKEESPKHSQTIKDEEIKKHKPKKKAKEPSNKAKEIPTKNIPYLTHEISNLKTKLEASPKRKELTHTTEDDTEVGNLSGSSIDEQGRLCNEYR